MKRMVWKDNESKISNLYDWNIKIVYDYIHYLYHTCSRTFLCIQEFIDDLDEESRAAKESPSFIQTRLFIWIPNERNVDEV